MTGEVLAIAAFGERVYLGGQFTAVDGTSRKNLAALDRTTGAVTPVPDADGASDVVRALAVRPGGTTVADAPARLYVGGEFSQLDQLTRARIAALDLDGAVTPDFGGTGFSNGGVRALRTLNVGSRLAPAWRLYAAGTFTQYGAGAEGARKWLAAFDAAPSLLPWAPTIPSDPGGGPFILTLAAAGQTVYAGGTFGVRAWHRDSGALQWQNTLGYFGNAQSLLVIDGALYVGGGFFELLGGIRRTNAAAFDAATGAVRPWDPELSGQIGVGALAPGAGGSVVAGGDFVAGGGEPRGRIAALDLISGTLTPYDPRADGDVRALAVHAGRLYAGGAFTMVNGATPRRRLAAFDLATGAATPFDPDLDNAVDAIAASGGTVYASGSFTTVNGSVPRAKLTGFDAATGSVRDLQPVFDSSAAVLIARGTTLFMGGSMSIVNGAPRSGMAAVQDVPGTGGGLAPFDPRADNFVLGATLDGDVMYAGGQFDHVGVPPQPRKRLAAFALPTGAALPWNPGVDGLVRSLARAGDAIVAGGVFSTAGGAPRNNLAALDPLTGVPSAWAPEPDDRVEEMASSPDAGLVIGGGFDRVGDPAQLTGPIAAFAVLPTAPAAPVASAGDRSATVVITPPPSGGAQISRYSVTVSPGGRTVTGTGPEIVVDGLANGTAYSFTAAATNRVGTSPASPPSVPVMPAPPALAGGPAPVADGTAPVIRALTMTRRRFAPANGGTRRVAGAARKAGRGSAFRFTVSEPATTVIAIARALPGKRKGSRCVKPGKNLKRRCTRFVKAAALTRPTAAGANRVGFSGRVGKRRLKPGAYRATLVATDAAGNRSSPARIAFRVVRR